MDAKWTLSPKVKSLSSGQVQLLLCGTTNDIRSLADFQGVALDIARRAAWISLSKTRQGYAGLKQGADHSATLKFQRKLATPAQQEQMLSILCDGVWSQQRAAQVGVCDGKCLHCPQPQADSHHLW